jgi:hypothetical protein
MSTNQGRAALPDGHGWARRAVAEQLAACAAKPGRRACVWDYLLQREGRGPRLLMGR